VLFLKRLLYLKALLDNEKATNTASVPLEEDIRAFSPPKSRRADEVLQY
jgi:hypothetical protein